MKTYRKGTYIGVIGTLIVHLVLILSLVFVYFIVPEPEEESGVPIVMGFEEAAVGGEKVAPFIEVDVMPEQTPPPVSTDIKPDLNEQLITQDLEETVAIEEDKPEKKKAKIEVKEEVVPKKQEEKLKTPEEVIAEKAKAEAERKRREKEKMEAAARERVANAFGKGTQMNSDKTGAEKVKDGVDNVISSSVSSSNQSGYGTFDLGGRSLSGKGGLPKPVYNVPEEGKVVVSIIVNPQGRVTSTSIHPKTNTMNAVLRKAAEEAAKKAQFNSISGFNNQEGTITYYFNFKTK